jgi:beta-glucosidase
VQIAAQEASADGINWTFPNNISKEPRWGRVSEGSGEDPFWEIKLQKQW